MIPLVGCAENGGAGDAYDYEGFWLVQSLGMAEQTLVRGGTPQGLLADAVLRELGHKPTWKERAEMARYLLGPQGLVVSVLPRYLALLKPGFQPWDLDDAYLVEEWKDRLQTAWS